MSDIQVEGVGFATRRMLTYTVLIIGLGVCYVFASTVGAIMVTKIGSAFESYEYPPLDSMNASIRDEETGKMVIRTLPPFQIEETKWVGEDLLLVRGSLCKAHDYQFIASHWFFGEPDGYKIPAKFVPASRGGSKGIGCQRWESWTLIGAGISGEDQFYADLVYRPQHNLWNVHYQLGPFPIPPKD